MLKGEQEIESLAVNSGLGFKGMLRLVTLYGNTLVASFEFA